jgi:NADPH:quinone reductase
MNAIVVREFGGPEVMKLADVPVPKPGAGQVLVHVKAAGVNPVDTYICAGTYARKPNLPYTPGTDGAGIVEAVGDAVKQFKKGDRVYLGGASVSGTYAEYCTCDSADAHPLPEKITFAQGAAMHVPYATALHALFNMARARYGEIVLIHGASGGVGTAAVQLARAAGLRVIASAGSDRGVELAKKEGADEVVNHSDPAHFDQVMKFTGGRGVDVIVEMLANVNLGNDLKILAFHGRCVVVGNRGEVQINPREIMAREAVVTGMTLWAVKEDEMVRIHRALIAGLESGTLRPVIGKELSLAEAERAHADVMASGAHGKIVLLP